MPVVNNEQIEQWKKEYGDVYQLTGDVDTEEDLGASQVFYFRKPGRKDLSRFVKEMAKDMYKATNNLVYGCLLYPSADVVRKMAEEKPGLILALGGELQKIIGSSQDFLSKKL